MVQKYQALVYTVCHQLVPDVQEAQDLTQETFLAAWQAIDRCPSGFEKQWLARIASNKAKDYLRSAWVRRVNIPGDDVLALEGAPPGTQPEQQVLDALGEEGRHLPVAVDHENVLGLGLLELADPIHQMVVVGVGAEALEIHHLGPDGYLLTEQLHTGSAVQQGMAQRTGGPVSYTHMTLPTHSRL